MRVLEIHEFFTLSKGEKTEKTLKKQPFFRKSSILESKKLARPRPLYIYSNSISGQILKEFYRAVFENGFFLLYYEISQKCEVSPKKPLQKF